MTMAIAATLLAAAAAACGPRTVALEPKKISMLQIVPPTGAPFCANDDETSLRVIVHYLDGTTLATRRGPGKRPNAWIRMGELAWTASLGVVDPNGWLFPPPDRLTWLGQAITARVTVVRQPSLANSTTLVPRYDCGYVIATGAGGLAGFTGEHGGPGAPGARVHVALTYVDLSAQRRWVLARVHIDGAPGVRYYVVDPLGSGRFTVDARGGEGGSGGQGDVGASGRRGHGGADGHAGTGCSSGGHGGNGGDGEDGGPGGPGGNGGDGGDGGTISLEYDARYPELARLIQYAVDGGGPGAPGAGGAGGSGGSGGAGGDGGKAGRGASGTSCSASAGASGSSGRDGSSGPRGPDGAPGRPGRPGELRARAADAAALFRDELARAVPIPAAPDAGAPPPPGAP
jgi:hypothetical protein